MVLVIFIVIMVIVGFVWFIIVPMVLRRVMLMCSFVVVVSGMVLDPGETLFGGRTDARGHHCANQQI